jgi:hypothetical protein
MNDDKSPESSIPSHFDKLSDTLDHKMLDFNLKLLGVLSAILFKPAAVATEPFFRKNMGERYFTYTNAVLASLIWLGLMALSKLFSFAGELDFEPGRTASHAEVIGGLFQAVFLVLAGANLAAARQRQKKGIRWHSMCRGESLFGSEGPIRDWIITVVVVVVLFKFHAALFAAFFLLSRIFSEYLEQQRQRSRYNRYLDIMDAQIESEHLQQTLAKGPAPMVTDGIYCPLPGSFQGEHREKVARVVAGTFSAPDVAAAPAASSPEAKAANMPNPLNQWTGQTKKVVLALYAAIGLKRLVLGGMIILLVAVIWAWGIPFVKSHHFHRNPPVVASAPSPQPAKQADVISAASAPQIKIQAAGDEQKKIQQQQHEEQARVAAQEEQRITERNLTIEQIKQALDNELSQVTNFKTACLLIVNGNTNRIAKVSSSSRNALAQRNNDERRQDLAELEKQERVLTHDQQSVQDLISNANTDAQLFFNQVKVAIGSMQNDRQQITASLEALDSDISKTPTAP